MKSRYCSKCNKATPACYCKYIVPQENETQVIILRHPSESKHPLGTALMTKLCFKKTRLFDGEDFSNHNELNQILKDEGSVILFPSENPKTIKKHSTKIKNIIVLDGTWKKAKKIYYLSKNLHHLPMLSLSNDYKTQYKIRKEPKDNYLSTIEATTFALEEIEKGSYQSAINTFKKMIEFQVEMMGEENFQEFY